MSYHLNKIQQIDDLLYNSSNRSEVAKSLNLKLNNWKHKNGSTYHILKYNKEWLASESVTSVGLLRSLIYKDDGTIVCFAPPKSLPTDTLVISESMEYVAEKFIEGTMMNVFYDKHTNSWEIATKSCVGGYSCFFREKGFKEENTFKYMFEEVCNQLNFNLNTLNQKYIYSFVMQHPRNRIVTVIKEMRLYLVEVYQVVDNTIINIISINREFETFGLPSTVRIPKQTVLRNMDDLERCKYEFASMNAPYYVVGLVIKNKLGERYKYRNPNYEHVRNLRGNQPKLQYQYLHLRHIGKVSEYLQYYKEHKRVFEGFRQLLHDYTNELYSNYIRCYIKKEKVLTEFPEKFRTHMYTLHHEIYLKSLMPNNKYVTKQEVINYFNHLHPARQMFILNYDVRQQYKDNVRNDNPTKNLVPTSDTNVDTNIDLSNDNAE